MPVVTRGSLYHTISVVAAQGPVREVSMVAAGFLDTRLGRWPRHQVPEVVLRGEGHQKGAGALGRAIGGGQRRPPGQATTGCYRPHCVRLGPESHPILRLSISVASFLASQSPHS